MFEKLVYELAISSIVLIRELEIIYDEFLYRLKKYWDVKALSADQQYCDIQIERS